MLKYLEITEGDFAWCVKFIFGLALQHLVSQGLRNFTQGAKFNFLSAALYPTACTPFGILHVMRKFRIAMRNCWLLDFSYDSLSCILDWLDKGYEALQSLDSCI